MSDTSETISDTISDILSDTSDTISDELQQDINEAIVQCTSIKSIHDNILEKMSSLTEHMADTIYVIADGHPDRDLDIILQELYQDALIQVEATGHHQFGSMLLSALDKTEFKYSTSTL